ncbi:hypothetical protein [Undibacterium sp. RuRC25W]|uniref:hypothetical protein n=1 Tax=Undibacterium sp. RuRC25W TaxID=3413047 RepID=UPI003BF15239
MSIAKILYRLSMLVMLCLVATSVFAQVVADRQFPPQAKRGVLNMSNYPNVITMDGVQRHLAVSSRIYSVTNLIVVPSSVTSNSLVVNYTVNVFNDIDKVWILIQSEMAKKLPTSN